jgi:hypothetical protein
MSHPLSQERRKFGRRNLTCFMMATEPGSQGFLLGSPIPLPPGYEIVLEVDAAPDRSYPTPLCFTARAKWCRSDSFEPSLYNIGFEITDIAPNDEDILRETTERYTLKENQPLA